MESSNLLFEIQMAKAKLYSLMETVLGDPKTHIRNVTQYNQVRKIIKTLNEPSLNKKWKEINEGYKFYTQLYNKHYRERGKLNG